MRCPLTPRKVAVGLGCKKSRSLTVSDFDNSHTTGTTLGHRALKEVNIALSTRFNPNMTSVKQSAEMHNGLQYALGQKWYFSCVVLTSVPMSPVPVYPSHKYVTITFFHKSLYKPIMDR